MIKDPTFALFNLKVRMYQHLNILAASDLQYIKIVLILKYPNNFQNQKLQSVKVLSDAASGLPSENPEGGF